MAEQGLDGASANMQAYIDRDDVDIALSCFRPSVKLRLSYYLNQEVAAVTESGHCPDWGGLAELIGFDGLEIGDIGRNVNPGKEVINRWIGTDRPLHPTVGRLVEYLVMLEREDILTDLSSAFQKEIDFHKNRHQHFNSTEQPIQDETVSSFEMEREYNHILTIDDNLNTITIYDAFVCYEMGDIRFVRQMIQRLEDIHGFRLFVPGRNNLVGTNSYELMTRLISERCRHMIVVLSNSFVQSDVCNFQHAYAFSLNPGARDKKMVPIKIEDCPIPETLRIMACCDFTNVDLMDWSWQRLAGSIMRPMMNSEFVGPEVWNNNQPPRPFSASSTSTLQAPSSSTVSVSPSSSSSRAAAAIVAPSSVPTSSRTVAGPSNADSGFSSALRSVPESASSSSRQNPSSRGGSSASQDSHSNVKSNVSKALKRFTNFAASPKSRKNEKIETTKF